MYRIEIDSAADKALRRMPRNTAELIRSKLLALAADPFAPNDNIRKLTGRDGYRLRVGDWRVIYTLDGARAVVSVTWSSNRGEAPMIEPQVITRDGEPEYVVIPIEEWHRIREMLEELEDIRDLDAALARPDRRMIPFEVTSAILDGVNPIRAWREHRGLTQRALAGAAGIAAPYLSQLEAGRRRGTAAVLRKLAGALGARVDDLIGDGDAGRLP